MRDADPRLEVDALVTRGMHLETFKLFEGLRSNGKRPVTAKRRVSMTEVLPAGPLHSSSDDNSIALLGTAFSCWSTH